MPYVHSFALTERYAVVPLTPFGVSPRAPLPHRLPYPFHGQFYAAADPSPSTN